MASFQLDFKSNIEEIFKMVELHKNSSTREQILMTRSYYDKKNATIMNLPDRTYWSDRIVKDKAGNICYDDNGNEKRINGEVKNPFVSNNRIPYGIYADIVNQKVNTLLDEAPTIVTDYKFDKTFINNLGYVLKNAGIEASNSVESYIFLDKDNKFTLFDSANCIPFYDDYTGQLKAFIRYMTITSSFNGESTMLVELYETDGLTVFELKNNKQTIRQLKQAYKYKVRQSAIESETKIENIGTLPIIVFKNNKQGTTDLSESTRAKIDAIDLVQSGFVNNIEDFSDIFWFIKSANADVDSDYYEDFMANINKTKRIFAEEAVPQQFQIPHEARSRLVELFKQELIEENGIIDTQNLTATQLTTVAIKAATMKLRQRVSDFEWQAYECVQGIIDLYKAYNGLDFDYEIEFTEMLVENDTELLDNMIKVESLMSLDDKLIILKRVGLISDIEATKKALEEESSYKLVDEPIDDISNFGDVDDGQSAQSNG